MKICQWPTHDPSFSSDPRDDRTGYDPDSGLVICQRCHKRATLAARNAPPMVSDEMIKRAVKRWFIDNHFKSVVPERKFVAVSLAEESAARFSDDTWKVLKR